MRADPIVLSRRRIGQWSSILGGALLLLGILGWLWQGGLSVAVGLLLAGGAAGLGLWLLATPREFMDFVTGRQVRYGTVAVFSSLLLIGIVALMYILAARAALTLDMTLTQSFTLSLETQDVLRNVRRPMQITGFYSADAVQQREIDDQFFRLYETATDGLITRQYINPNEEPALARRYGTYTDGTVFLAYLGDDGSVDFDTLMRVPRSSGGAQEREMTQAIARMLLSGSLKVYFETDLSELDPLDDTQQGLSGVHLGMQENGLITDALSLPELAASGGSIPDDASLFIMPRPGRDLTPAEINVLDEYLQRGGALLIMADVQYTGDTFLAEAGAFAGYLWDNYGLGAYDAALVDEAANLRTPLDVIGAAAFTDTDIGARLDPEEAPTLFRLARPLRIASEPPVNNGRVIASSPVSYGETNLQALGERNDFTFDDGEDIPGPLDIAAWAWDLDSGAKILLIGDSDFATNGYVSTALGNAILFTDGVAWLTGLSEQISFAPQGIATGLPLVFVSTEQLGLIGFFTIIVMPGLALVLGLVVWTWRVRR